MDMFGDIKTMTDDLENLESMKAILVNRQINEWLGRDRMGQQSEYHSSLEDLRAGQACEFLLTDVNFINWYRAPDSQQLAIVGDTGVGKTVAMSFLVDELNRRHEHQQPRPITCYYYCRHGETGRDVNIYSTLVLGLLVHLPDLKPSFFKWYKNAQASGCYAPARITERLEEFLQLALETLDRPLHIVIDGLDQCDEESRNNLLASLKTLSQRTPRVKTILSTPPQEDILEQLGETPRIELSPNDKRDRLIVEKAVERWLPYLSDEVKAFVIERLSCMAQGSGIWIRTVIEHIQATKNYAQGAIQCLFEEDEETSLPGDLSKFYDTLLSQCTSDVPQSMETATIALKILAVARRPLSILELAWAVAVGEAPREVTTVAALDPWIDHQRLMCFIYPFVARVDFRDVKKRQIQLLHPSVKEFIIKECTSNRLLEGRVISKEIRRILLNQRIENLEAYVLGICTRYLLLEEINKTDLFSEEQVAVEGLPQEIDLFSDAREPVEYDPHCSWETWEKDMIRYDPADRGFGEFFVYASCHWVEHFGAISTDSHLPGLAMKVESLCQADSTLLHNWIRQNCRPDCTIQPRFQFDSTLYDPLSITSLYGSEAMLSYMLREMLECSLFEKQGFLPESTMRAADQILQWGDLARLRILLEVKGYQLRHLDFFQLIIRRWFYNGSYQDNWESAFLLVRCATDTLIEEKGVNELLCLAANLGCMPMIRELMSGARLDVELRTELLRDVQREQQLLPTGQSVHQSIGEAVLRNHTDVVEFLLAEDGIEAHLQHINSRGENVLHLASKMHNPAMFLLLVPRFPEGVHQKDSRGDIALTKLIKNPSPWDDRYECARVLLSQGGGDWDGYSGDEEQLPLRVAVRVGDSYMCHLLLTVGKMDPLSALAVGEDGQMVLKDECTSEYKTRILAFLCRHAEKVTSTSAKQ